MQRPSLTAMTSIDTPSLVTPQLREQYENEGYFVLDGALSDEQLAVLRSNAQYAIDQADAQMDAAGVDRLGINVRGKRYFPAMMSNERPELRGFLFSDTMADICRAILGPEAYLFGEQYVIKAGDAGSAFAWHQDSGYVHEDHQPYLTCWIALDDITEDNGPVYLLPYSRSGIRSYVKHQRDPQVNDKVCYFGADPGIPVLVPAGSMACFSSVVIHRSGANRTDRLRRAYVAQYSREVIYTSDGSKPWWNAEPFLAGGTVVNRG